MKHLLLTVFLVVGFCFTNCSNDDDLCGNFVSLPFFDIFQIENLEHYILEDNIIKNIQDSTTVQLAEYAGLGLNFDVNYIAKASASNRWTKGRMDFSFMNSLVACTPVPSGTEGSKSEKMEDLQIITLFDFDAEHLAGSSLNDIMTIEGMNFEIPESATVNDYLAQDDLIKSERYLLKLTKAPVLTEDFQVKVMVSLNGGETYEETSGLIRLVD